jgi:hypothetical protein
MIPFVLASGIQQSGIYSFLRKDMARVKPLVLANEYLSRWKCHAIRGLVFDRHSG